LAKRPEDRYQSADALAGDLRRWLRNEPVLARAPGPFDRAVLRARRHPALSTAIAAAILIAAGAGIVSTILAFQLAAQKQQALIAADREADARRSAQRATAFLRDTLAAARPAHAGPEATVLDALRDAAARADRELEGDPAVAAEVFYTVGHTLRSLWKFREAIPHLERAVELAIATSGENSEATARALVALGTCFSNTGGDPRAIPTQQRALAIRRELYTGDHPLIAESLMRTGYALFRASSPAPDAPDWPAAESHLSEALAMFRRLHGDAHRDVGSCLHNIAYMHVLKRDDAAAETWFARAIAAFRAAGDLRDPYYAECLTGYAPVLSRLDKPREALDITRELIPLAYDLYGREAGDAQTRLAAALSRKLNEPGDASSPPP
jgi:serine/threonine-protein kinase